MLSDEDDHAFGTIGIRSGDGLFATQTLKSDGRRTMCSTQSSKFQLSGSNPGTGLCSIAGSRIAARYRDKFASSAQTFLSHGIALQDGFSQHAGQRKSNQAVGNFCQPLDLYFWRDSVGNEVDLITETAQGLQPLEIKSGSTYARDWAQGIRKWQALAGAESLEPALVCGGTEPRGSPHATNLSSLNNPGVAIDTNHLERALPF